MMNRDFDRNDRERRERELTEDEKIERDARSHHEFTLADAVGQVASDGFLKGASPVPRLRQIEMELVEYVNTHLLDSPGALKDALRVEIERNSSVLAKHLDAPLEGLSQILKGILRSDERLTLFVEEVDATWGRIYQERPVFERPGEPPDPDDPYTIEVVRKKLESLRGKLGGASAERMAGE